MRLPPPRFLLIQFGRLGDLAQSLPLAERLLARYPRAEIIIACRDVSARVWARAGLPFRFLTLDGPAMGRLGRMRRDGALDREAWLSAYPELKKPFHAVLNLSADFESSVFGGLAEGATLSGRGPAPEGRMAPRGRAARYFFAASLRRRENPIHAVDWQMSLAELFPGRWEPKVRRELPAFPAEPGRPVRLGVQLGASDRHRALEPETVAAAIHSAYPDATVLPVLLGDAGETDLGLRFAKAFGGAVENLIGKTSLEALPDAVSACDFLVSNDTGTLHIAAYLGLPTLSWFFATAYHRETAPYGAGHHVLQADLPCAPCSVFQRCAVQECRRSFQPAVMASALKAAMEGRPADFVPPPGLKWLAGGFHSDGYFEYRPVSGAVDLADEGKAKPWRRFLAGRATISGAPRPGNRSNAGASREREEALAETRVLAERGRFLSRQIASLAGSDAGEDLDPRLQTYFAELKNLPHELENAAQGWPLWRDVCLFQWEDPAWSPPAETAEVGGFTDIHPQSASSARSLLRDFGLHHEALFARILEEAELLS